VEQLDFTRGVRPQAFQSFALCQVWLCSKADPSSAGSTHVLSLVTCLQPGLSLGPLLGSGMAPLSPTGISSKQCLEKGHAQARGDRHQNLSPRASSSEVRMWRPVVNQSHALPDPTSAKISPQKDINGQQEKSVNVANSLPEGLLLNAGKSALQGSFLFLGQSWRGAGGQTTEPQIQCFPAGRFGFCETQRKYRCYHPVGTTPCLLLPDCVGQTAMALEMHLR